SEVLTQAGTCSPRSTAFLASKPAAIITEGFEVLVQLVMAAITTLPLRKAFFTPGGTCSSCGESSTPTAVLPPSCSQRVSPLALTAAEAADCEIALAATGLISDGRDARNDSPAWDSATRSWGRFGPARLGSTVERSSASNSEYSASGVFSSWKSPCSRQYASTSAICSSERPVRRRYVRDSWSTGKMPQ